MTILPDPAALFAAYQAAQAAADTAWVTWNEARRAGGSIDSGNLYSQAYRLQAQAETARQAYVAAHQQADPGARALLARPGRARADPGAEGAR